VRFQYNRSHTVLDEIDLRIPYGETIAVVGPNGCGKSTLVNLVPAFTIRSRRHPPRRHDLRDVRLQDLRGQIGVVTQETLLFTIRCSTTSLRHGPTPRRASDRSRPAGSRPTLHRRALEQGYETVVGARGALPSGGPSAANRLAEPFLRDRRF